MFRLRARSALALLPAILAPTLAYGQSDRGLWRFADPNATALIGIDWAHIRQSPAGALLRQNLQSGGALSNVPTIDLLNDVDRILISSPAVSPDASGDAPFLIAIRGRFDLAKLHPLLAQADAKPQAYNSFQVYRPQAKQAKDIAFVLFDNETVLFGDPASVFATLDRNQFAPTPENAAPPPKSMLSRAMAMESYDIWAMIDGAELMSNESLAAFAASQPWASEVKGFQVGANVHSGLEADVTVRFASEDTAKQLVTELTGFIALAAKDRTPNSPVRDIARNLKLARDGSDAKINLLLTQQQMVAIARAFATSHKASANVSMKSARIPARPAAPAPAVPPKRAVIRIEGLDDGPREVPYQDPQN